jgi:RNA-binding protein
VQLGKGGLDEGVIRAVDAALEQHELIKVKLSSEAPEGRHDAAEMLAESTGASIAQVLGRTILLYRRHPKEPRIVLPSGRD